MNVRWVAGAREVCHVNLYVWRPFETPTYDGLDVWNPARQVPAAMKLRRNLTYENNRGRRVSTRVPPEVRVEIHTTRVTT
ncbi:MAG TPA: hypothetical protein VMS71_01730 [Candidatus Acidoferrum sp.]|nr:hypothetical protein [Candidatus Acidoferrum sp.]